MRIVPKEWNKPLTDTERAYLDRLHEAYAKHQRDAETIAALRAQLAEIRAIVGEV